MSIESKLAELYIELTTRGYDRALAENKKAEDSVKFLGQKYSLTFKQMGEDAKGLWATVRKALDLNTLPGRLQGAGDSMLKSGPLSFLAKPKAMMDGFVNAVSYGFSAAGGIVSGFGGLVGGALGKIPYLGGLLGGAVKAISTVAGELLGIFGKVLGGIASLPGLFLGAVNQMLVGVQRLGAAVFAAGAGFITYFTRAALQGTWEGERLAKSWEMLSRSIGNIFLPYVRMLSAGLQYLARAFHALDPGTKSFIARVILIGTAAAGVVVVLGFIATALTAILNPMNLLIGGLGYLAYKWVESAAKGKTWEEKITSVLGAVIEAYYKLMANLSYVWPYIREAMKATFENMINYGKWFVENFRAISVAIMESVKSMADVWKFWVKGMSSPKNLLRPDLFYKDMDAMIEAEKKKLMDKNWGDIGKGMPALVRGNFEQAGKEANEGWNKWMGKLGAGGAIAGGLIDKLKNLFGAAGGEMKGTFRGQVAFETSQAGADRLQQALATNDQIDIGEATLGKVGEIFNLLQQAIASGIPINNLRPAVGR